jgi:cytosine/adenosine deaminase-related metal-dependent hydrolase
MFPRARAAPGMGVDGEGSSDLPDPFENMRMGLYRTRARYESAKSREVNQRVARLH